MFDAAWGRILVPGLTQPGGCAHSLSAFPSTKFAHGLKIKTFS